MRLKIVPARIRQIGLIGPALLTCLLPLAGAERSAPNNEAALLAVLKSNAGQKEKADACRELARKAGKEVVPVLAALLADEQLSHMARYALETIPDPSVNQALRAALTTLSGRQLVGVIGSLGVRRDANAVQPLSNLLTAPDPEVAQAAARALGFIGTPEAARALQITLATAPATNRLAICEGLFRCAETFAAHGHAKTALPIYDQLRTVAGPVQVREGALRGAILARSRGEGLLLLQEALRNARPDSLALFDAALRTSLEMPGADVTRALVAELPKVPADYKILLIQALGQRGDPAVLPALSVSARTGDKTVRVAAIRATGRLGEASAAPMLLEVMGDNDSDVAQAAEETLAGLPGRRVDSTVRAMLTSTDTKRQRTGIALAERRRLTSAAPELLKLARGPEPTIRPPAVEALGKLLPASQTEVILDLLANARNPDDLDAAERALGTISLKAANAETCAASLGARMAGMPPDKKCAMLRVLAAVGGANALKSVRASADDPAPEVHGAAIRALCGWSTVDAALELLALAQNAPDATDKKLCLRGYLSLAGHADIPDDKRLSMCGQASVLIKDDDDKKLLLATLGGVYSTESLELILPYLDDPSIKAEAATASLNVAWKLLDGPNASKAAPKLIAALEKVSASSSDDLSQRAKNLLEKAQAKANATK